MAGAAWTVTRRHIEEDAVPGKPLGRHVEHDSRSLAYRHQRSAAAIETVLHERRVPIFDQGQVGSCTGNAEAGALGTDPLHGTLPAGHPALDETEALRLYSAAETIDGDGPYPPQDNGSSGLSVCKAAKNAGLISGYTHLLDADDVKDALQAGPVILGTNWYSSFDEPGSDGELHITAKAKIRGGHEYVCRGYDTNLDLFTCDNSWGPDWGVAGSFYLSTATLTRLLAEDGDGTVSIPLTQPAPTPAPGPQTAAQELWSVAGPWCSHDRTRPDLVTLKAALEAFAAAEGLS